MFQLPPLPFAYDALQPVLSERTLRVHHDKHQGGYVNTLNTLMKSKQLATGPLEDIILTASQSAEDRKLFNNAAQVWNHTFFWQAMSPERQSPGEALSAAVEQDFGGVAGLKEAFVGAGAEHFGSGWVWLASDKSGGLRVLSTHDASGTLGHSGITPLLVCDLWEHAYYLDHEHDRKGFLAAWFDTLPNWTFADDQYAASRGRGAAWAHPLPDAQA